jgi:hypothetical protein
MKYPTHYCLILFTGRPVKTISLKTQLSMISVDFADRKSGMISAKSTIGGIGTIRFKNRKSLTTENTENCIKK